MAGALYAAGVVALGRLAIHTGGQRQRRATTAPARAMVADGTPAERAHGGWLPALGALDAAGPAGRITPLYPMDVTDDPQLVRIALAAGTAAAAQARADHNPKIANWPGWPPHRPIGRSGTTNPAVPVNYIFRFQPFSSPAFSTFLVSKHLETVDDGMRQTHTR